MVKQGRLDCTGCFIVKAIEKGVAEGSKINTTKSVERVCIETTRPYTSNTGGTRYCMCALDYFIDMP